MLSPHHFAGKSKPRSVCFLVFSHKLISFLENSYFIDSNLAMSERSYDVLHWDRKIFDSVDRKFVAIMRTESNLFSRWTPMDTHWHAIEDSCRS